MSFNRAYSDLLAILPDSVIQEGWARLTTRKRKPLTETEASGINPIVESFLKHEAQRYQNKLMRQRQIKGCPTLCEHGTLETGIHMAGNEEIINKEIALPKALSALHKRLLEYNRDTFGQYMQDLDKTHEKQIEANRQMRLEIRDLKLRVQEVESYLAYLRSMSNPISLQFQ